MALSTVPPTTHPFKQWMEGGALSIEQAALLIGAERRRLGEDEVMNVAYLRQILSGHRRPSWDIAKAMAATTRGRVTAAEIMDFKREGTAPGAVSGE